MFRVSFRFTVLFRLQATVIAAGSTSHASSASVVDTTIVTAVKFAIARAVNRRFLESGCGDRGNLLNGWQSIPLCRRLPLYFGPGNRINISGKVGNRRKAAWLSALSE